MSATTTALKHVNYLWDDAKAAKLSPAEQLVYRSNLLGSDQRITNTGGGNTSAKLMERDPLTGESVEVLWVKGSGGDLRTSNVGNFASLYQEKLLSLQADVCRDEPARPEDGSRRPHGGLLSALHVQSEPARFVHRYAAAFVYSGEACGPHAPEFGDLRGRVPPLAALDAGDFRRRGFVDAVAAPGLRTGSRTRAHVQGKSEAEGNRDGPARADQLGRRQQGMLRPHAAADRKGRAVHRAARQRREDLRRREIPDAAGGAAQPGAVRNSAVAARAGFQGEALHRHGAIRRGHSSFRQQPRCAAVGGAGHLVPRPLPAHQDQAALCRLESADRRRRRVEGQAHRGPGTIPQGLRGLLRKVQAAELAGDARSESDRDSDSGNRHDRLGQRQERIARYGRILQLRGGSDARRRSDRRIHRSAAAGSVRHRILAAGRGEAEAHAGRKGNGAQRGAGGGRGQRHRQSGRASAGEGGRARCLRRSQDGGRAGDRQRADHDLRPGHRRRRHGHFRMRPGAFRWRWMSPTAKACATCWSRRCWRMAASII